MRNLADTVLDYLWFLEFSEEEQLDPDDAVKMLESLSGNIEGNWMEDEKQALSEAAARRLRELQTPDEHGNYPIGSLTNDQRAFLGALAQGRFGGYLDFDEEVD